MNKNSNLFEIMIILVGEIIVSLVTTGVYLTVEAVSVARTVTGFDLDVENAAGTDTVGLLRLTVQKHKGNLGSPVHLQVERVGNADNLGAIELLLLVARALLKRINGKRIDTAAEGSRRTHKLTVSVKEVVLVSVGVDTEIVGTLLCSALPHGTELIFVQLQLNRAFHKFFSEHIFIPFR